MRQDLEERGGVPERKPADNCEHERTRLQSPPKRASVPVGGADICLISADRKPLLVTRPARRHAGRMLEHPQVRKPHRLAS